MSSFPPRHTPLANKACEDITCAWGLLLAASRMRRQCLQPMSGSGLIAGTYDVQVTEAEDPRAGLICDHAGVWRPGSQLSKQALDLVEFYLPLLAAAIDTPVVVGHLGQSVDARIATENGHAMYVTGEENLRHLHRMRALCDAIIVGASTVAIDDPRLTTRLVEGPNPVRIVIDPLRRLAMGRQVFNDGEARTLIACAEDLPTDSAAGAARENIIELPVSDDGLCLSALLTALQSKGLHAVFVEGGGVTVSRWMNAGLLDRLQVATAPVLIGGGRPALQLPPAINMDAAQRPPHRMYRMGNDVLWDFDLRTQVDKQAAGSVDMVELQRLW
jgi:riboflavin-specific deaminase-like protein